MKHLVIAASIFLSASAASGFQQQIGSSELDPSNRENLAFREFAALADAASEKTPADSPANKAPLSDEDC
jgi:hypothetical protein